MNRYNYFSEKAALEQEMLISLRSNSEFLLQTYLKDGIESVFNRLNCSMEWQKKLLFDFLVFELNAIHKLIEENNGFFLSIIGRGEGSVIRKMLGIEGKKYDLKWLEILNLLNEFYLQKVLNEKLENFACSVFFEMLNRKYDRIRRNDNSAN
ncbi:hypothetical protein GF376_00320 [Candidatus Peregrinibacteria bacterium]|nr:hypothetical protein [Candidatus Peregrinibacteria bacterium]